jgi:TRAP-type mannitol/chloroaromatic compound transport system permease small subunit
MHGALIMFGVGYTFLHNGHVRVDIFYADASEKQRNWTDLIGSLLFMLPVCYVMWWSAQPNVAMSWANLEGSTESSGIPYKYLLKSTVMVAAVLLALQGISTALKCALRLAGHVVHDPYRGEESLD